MIQCRQPYTVPTHICGQHRHCIRELGPPGFCMSLHYGWPFYWLPNITLNFPLPHENKNNR